MPADAFDFGHELRWIGKGFVARMQEAGSHPCSHPSQRLGSTALTSKVLGPPRAWNLAETALGKTCAWSDSCVLTIWPRTAQRNYVSLYVQMQAIECRCIICLSAL